MEIEDVLQQWKDVSKIDESDLLHEIIKTPSIHADFLTYFVFYKKKLVSSEIRSSKLAGLKRKYYRGEMTRDELEDKGWNQYQGLKPSGSELTQLLSMDSDMIEAEAIVDTYKNNVAVLEYILKMIGQRDYSLKSAVDVQKYLSGN